MTGTVYTETTIYSPPEAFATDAPYQIAIVSLEDGKRVTVRIAGEPVRIGDSVSLTDTRDGILFFARTNAQ